MTVLLPPRLYPPHCVRAAAEQFAPYCDVAYSANGVTTITEHAGEGEDVGREFLNHLLDIVIRDHFDR